MNIAISDSTFVIKDSPFVNLSKIDRIYIGSKLPGTEGVRYLLDQHVQTFIDFKLPGEAQINEHDLVAAAGAEYINCPVASIEQMDRVFLQNMNTLLRECEGQIAIYCMSGNRIVAWLMLHLCIIQKMSVDEVYAFSQNFTFVREETRQAAIKHVMEMLK